MTTVFEKTYDGESIADLPRDINEMWNPKFNPDMLGADLNPDENGIPVGNFKVTITFEKGN